MAEEAELSRPRLLRVKDHYSGMWPLSQGQLEEVWFDESDELGSHDLVVRANLLHKLHPNVPPDRHSILSLGDHYYRLIWQY